MNADEFFNHSVLFVWHVSFVMLARAALVAQFPKLLVDNSAMNEQFPTLIAIPIVVAQNVLVFGVFAPLIMGDQNFSFSFALKLTKLSMQYTLLAWAVLTIWLRIHGRTARLQPKIESQK